HPAPGDVVVTPVLWRPWIDLQHQVYMIAHHRVGMDRYRKALAEKGNPVLDPTLPMLE
ncbi:MAG: hypothetical protein JNN30_08435, partial [Rhodanobacteraceae bacterium]|nr:hypothetical protein [Rhodanobacteraceae bacterium]